MGCAPKSIMYLRLTPVWFLNEDRYMLSTSSLEKVSASFLELPVAAAAAAALPAREAGDEDANPEAPRPTVSNAPADDRAARLTAAHDDILAPRVNAQSRTLTHYVRAAPTFSSPHTLRAPHAPQNVIH